MRIAFLGNGMTGYLDAQYRALHDLGHTLLVVQPGSPDVAVGAMRDTAFGDLGIDEYAEHLLWTREPTKAELVERVARFAPDAVVMTAWNFSDSYRAVMRSVPSGVVRILVMDNLWRAAPRQWLGRLVSRWYVGSVADVAMVPSERSESYARMLGFGPGDVVRGSLSADDAIFRSNPRSGEELASRRRFLWCGRLVDHKGVDVLASAYRRYRELVDEPWDLDVVGLGPQADLLDGTEGVVRHGFVAAPDVADLMRRSTCFVLPSHVEPYGVVLHEAAACGLPILSTDFAGAAASFVQDAANGWVVPAGDVEAWARAMARVHDLSPERLGEMSDVSRALARRTTPRTWALNLAEQVERRRGAPGGRRSVRA